MQKIDPAFFREQAEGRERPTTSTSGTQLRSPVSREGTRCVDRLVDVLEEAGVDIVYGVPGGAISPVYDALIDHPRIRVVHTRHETSAVFMAIGHTRVRPEALPCVLVTSGPGVTNAVTGLAAVQGERVPALVIGGEVPRSRFGRRALQEGSPDGIDTLNIVRTVTRSATCATIPGHAPFQLAQAIEQARAERGPVFVSLPLDVAVAPLQKASFARAPLRRFLPDPRAMEQAAAAIRRARRPLIIVGSGARGASAAVRAFAERTGIPVMTSPRAKGIFSETAPYSLGVFGYGGHPTTTEWLRAGAPDVVVALGCGFGETSTNSWSPLLQATDTMIQVELDASQLGRNYRVDVALCGDCADVVPALLPLVGDRVWDLPHRGITRLEPEKTISDQTPLAPARVLTVLQQELPDDTVYTCDIGEHLLFAIHYLSVTRPDQFIASLSLGSMGSGIGAAIGAKLAAPERRVVAICGDFGFQMYGMDLNTCVHEGIGLVFVVLNDSRMRMVEAGIARNYGRGLPMYGASVDFAAIARAHGARGFVAETSADLRRALRSAAADGPTVIDVRIDPDAAFPVNSRADEISNFTSR